MSRRTDRIEDQLRTEISDILRRELRDPRVGMASISDIHVTADLRHARVLVSVLGEEDSRNDSVEALRHASGFIRSRVAHRLRHLRVTPELAFELDRGPEHSQRIEQILEELHEGNEST